MVERLEESLAGAVKAGLDVARVTEEITVQLVVGIGFVRGKGEGESGEGGLGEGVFRFVALGVQIMNGLFEK